MQIQGQKRVKIDYCLSTSLTEQSAISFETPIFFENDTIFSRT